MATWLAAIAASGGAGLIHLALGPEHLEELGALGLGFYLAAALQSGWSIAAATGLVAVRRSGIAAETGTRLRRLAGAGIAMNVAVLVAWLVSRTIGLPAGETPWVPEPIGRADSVSAILEGLLVVALIARLRRASPATPARVTLRRSSLLAASLLVVIGAGTAIGLAPEGHARSPDDVHAPPEADSHEPSVGEPHSH